MSSYGYMNYYKPVANKAISGASSVLAAAASAKDPYGLAPNNRSGPLGIGSGTGFAAAPKVTTPAPITANDPRIAASKAANPLAAGANGSLFTGGLVAPPTAASVNNYDLNTDAGLQQIQSLVGLSNSQAQSSALKQRQDLVLAYGDKGVAESVLGAGDPIAAAAGQNPTSTVAQLSQSRDRNLKTLDDQLNADNLGYSGYRVTQETQAGQDYQNALAQAAAGLNSNLDNVGSNLAAVLAGNNGQVVAGINGAADRHSQDSTLTGTDPGGGDSNLLNSGDGYVGQGGPSGDLVGAAGNGLPQAPTSASGRTAGGSGASESASSGGLANAAALPPELFAAGRQAVGGVNAVSATLPDALARALGQANLKKQLRTPTY